MTGIDRRSEILEQIRQCVCVDRCKTHGEAEVNLAHLADVWRWWIKARYGIDVPLDSLDSSQMMSLSKVSRKACNPYVVDHWADDAGYDVIGAGIVKKALDEQALKKELDGLAAPIDHGDEVLRPGVNSCLADEVGLAVDHGEEELKKTEDGNNPYKPCPFVMMNPFRKCILCEGHKGNHSYVVCS